MNNLLGNWKINCIPLWISKIIKKINSKFLSDQEKKYKEKFAKDPKVDLKVKEIEIKS